MASNEAQPVVDVGEVPDEIPTAEVALPIVMPTTRDRVAHTATFVLGALPGGGLAFAALRYVGASIAESGDYAIIVRGPRTVGAVVAGTLVGIVCGMIAAQWKLSCRFPDRDQRIVFKRLLRNRPRPRGFTDEAWNESRRAAAIRFAERHGRFDSATGIGVVTLFAAGGIYLWIAYSMMFVGITPDSIAWRGYSLARHERSTGDVTAIYETARPGSKGIGIKPALVVQFDGATQMETYDLPLTEAERDRAAELLSRASGIPIQACPWADNVPPPR